MMLHPVLDLLSEVERQQFLSKCSYKRLHNREKLVEIGQTVDCCYALCSGVLRLEVRMMGNPELTTTGLLAPPALVLETKLKPNYVSTRQVTVLGSADFVVIPLTHLLETLQRHPLLALALAEHFMTVSIALRRKIGRLHTASPVFQVARAMHEVAATDAEGFRLLSKHVKQGDLAASIGLSREQVNKVIKNLEAQNLVVKTREGYRIDNLFGDTSFDIDPDPQ